MKKDKLFEKFEKEIAVLIAVQKEGRPTIEDIGEKLKEWSINLASREITELCENLRRRDLLSIILERDGQLSVRKYALNKIKNIPNVAHYKDIVDYKEGKELLKYLDKTKGVNKGRTPDIKDYWKVQIVLRVKPGMTVRGFIPEGEVQGAFYKDMKGNPIFKPRHFQKFIGLNMRLVNKPESQADYIGFTIGQVKLNGSPIGKEETYIQVHRTGSGVKIWETLQEGAEIITTANVPQTLFEVEEFRKFLELVTTFGLVGLGGWGKGNEKKIE